MGDGEMLPVEVGEALERGALVLTANERAARALRHGFDQRNRARGLMRWEPPAVLVWDAWARGLWHGMVMQGEAAQVLLNHTQEHAVWRGVLEGDAELRSLRSVDSLAEMAADAWRLLCSYGGQSQLREMAVSTDTRAFQRWAMVFERRCRAEGYLSQAQLEEMLRSHVAAGRAELEAGELVLVGFDSMTPAQASLVGALRAAGVSVEELLLEVATEPSALVEAADESEELRTCARWVRRLLEARPEARVAVIVPGLGKQRAEIDRVFREVLAPELQDVAAGSEASPYEFSLGVPLAETAMGAVALDLLRWVDAPLALERVSGLLLSPYFAGVLEERGARAEFDAFDLRRTRMLRPEVSLERLIELVERSKRHAKLTVLLKALRRMQRAIERLLAVDVMRAHSEWADGMREVLEAAAWGAGEGEDSSEFQTRRKWESALDELATLDFDGVRVRFDVALDALGRIAMRTTFAPQSREAPVQVMGPLEAAGCGFDAVWFLRAGDLTWPAVVSGSPLLPWQMQREFGMPGTDAVVDSEFARRVTERIAKSAGTVVFSYAEQAREGKQRAAAVLEGLGLQAVAVDALIEREPERTVVEIETMEDSEPLPLLPDRVIHGGAKILELQAACGFRAFAEQRLWSAELRESELGMDASERGSVVHRVLEIFWGEVKTQDELKAMSAAELYEMLDWAIGEGLRRNEKLSSSAWDAAYMDLQRERLHDLLGPWLEMEMQRPRFTVKLQEDKLEDAHVGPLRLSVRVDRIDEGEEGAIIIDYKTGPAKPSDWLSERPDAPQLPLYAILSQAERLEGVAFAHVRAGKDRGLHGFATSKESGIRLAKLPAASLEAQVEEWRRVLTKLAEEFYNGDARVRPKNYPMTCKHCGQRMVCRLDVAAMDEDDDESATEEERG